MPEATVSVSHRLGGRARIASCRNVPKAACKVVERPSWHPHGHKQETRSLKTDNAAIGRKWLCAMVRRAKQPGRKFDHVPTLEGFKDIGKSTAVSSGPGDAYYSDAGILDAKDKEQQ